MKLSGRQRCVSIDLVMWIYVLMHACRSLIALTLIMELLLSKPTPMYILDEIDAALDL